MEPASGVWERDYSRRGKIWAGPVHSLPALPASSRVLELGCGNGKTTTALVRNGWNIVAVDFSHQAVSLCKSVTGISERGEICTSDARHLPFCDGSFDAVIAIHIIGHLAAHERKQVITEAFRVLRPGGTLIFRDFSLDDFRFGSGVEVETRTFRRGTGILTHYFTEDETLSLFSAFNPVSLQTDKWVMRVRGRDLVRAEIAAIFTH
jgi:ubiquinone/menaquinone biosynthesis C-methylase UbiE